MAAFQRSTKTLSILNQETDMSIRLEKSFDAEASALWAILGQPERIDWVPGIESCVFDGKVRAFTLPGAGALKEEILLLDHDQRRIEYSCFESPIPLTLHQASMQVTDTEGGCHLVWETRIEPEKFEPFIVESMEGALQRLQTILVKTT
ncbi:MAG: hypothetical protein ACI8PP_001145 [Candidatus Pseudothioglobus sp.]